MSAQAPTDAPKKRAPRAPSTGLEDALTRALKIYEKEGRHSVSADVACQDIGYKDGSSGPARTALATLRQYSLLSRTGDGKVSIAKEVEDYKFSPEKQQKQKALIRWLRSPAVYSQLLDKYAHSLPSDAALRYDLIQLGFPPAAAEEQVAFFKSSVTFADFYNNTAIAHEGGTAETEEDKQAEQSIGPEESATFAKPREDIPIEDYDRIPVRFSGGRRGYLMIPVPFYEEDKERMKAQIDLILVDKPEEGSQ